MTIKERICHFRGSKKKYMITLVLAVLVIFLAIYSFWSGNNRRDLVYAESLDMVAADVNGTQLTLRDLAFYVAYEEQEVDEQARLYNPKNPREYWSVRVDGGFVASSARNAAIQMAIHDELFYQMAMEEELSLTEEEEKELENQINDFWSDLADGEKDQKLGVTREDIGNTMRKMAYAQKYQLIYAELHNKKYEDYDFSAETYKRFMEKQDYKIHKSVWRRIDFGRVTL